jgi:hypothetical protein
VELLVQPVEPCKSSTSADEISRLKIASPVSGSTQQRQLLDRDVAGDELADWMTDEEICQLDVVPKVVPDFLLRGTFHVHKIATDLDVRSVDDGKLGPDFFDKRNETGHLGVI